MQALENHHCQFVDDALTDRQPVKFMQDRRDMVKLPGLHRNTSCNILNCLQLLQQAVIYTVQ